MSKVLSNNELLIIGKGKFGELTDSYKWCQYLRGRYNITYICFEGPGKRQELSGVSVLYVSQAGSRIIRGVRYILRVLRFLCHYEGKVIVIYFPGCECLKWAFSKKKMILDIRTLSVSNDKRQNEKLDRRLLRTCDLYDYVTVISKGVMDKLKLDDKKVALLPLGADVISVEDKDYSKIKLLYVGTFDNREIYKTIIGLKNYINNTGNHNIEYHIVGDGKVATVEKLKEVAFNECLLQNNVFFYGRVPHTELGEFFDKCNIGVSFVPMTDYYDYQPPTKTYEYILSGLFTIATSTAANKKIINVRNGLLIIDTSNDFAKAIEIIDKEKKNFRSDVIRQTLSEMTWQKIVNRHLLKILENK